MQLGQIGESVGEGISKRLGLGEAERAFQQASGDPVKLATAFARLMSVSPELARGAGPMYQAMLNQIRGQALGGLGAEEKKAPEFPYPTTPDLPESQETPTLEKPEDIQKQIEGFIRPTNQQIYNEAGAAYKQNPAMFGGDPDKAVDYIRQKYEQLEGRTQDYQRRQQQMTALQDDVIERLRGQVRDLGSVIPANAMSDIEQKAIQEIKAGKTVEQVKRDLGKEVDEASRKYKQIDDIGYGIYTNPKESISTLNALQSDFKKRNDLRNFADTIAAKMKVSYATAYSIADPLKDHPRLNQFINKLKTYKSINQGSPAQFAPELAKLIKEENASPQTVFRSLIEKNYNPIELKDYLSTNRDKLELTDFQVDQLGKEIFPTLPLPFLADIWLSTWGGLRKSWGGRE